jgi:hypothetical protein
MPRISRSERLSRGKPAPTLTGFPFLTRSVKRGVGWLTPALELPLQPYVAFVADPLIV